MTRFEESGMTLRDLLEEYGASEEELFEEN